MEKGPGWKMKDKNSDYLLTYVRKISVISSTSIAINL